MSKQNIKLVKYSEKCYVLTGEGTKEHRKELKAMKMRWNNRLRKKDSSGNVFGGWLISLNKVDQIKERFNLEVSPL